MPSDVANRPTLDGAPADEYAPLLEVEHLHTTFRVAGGTVKAVDDVSLRLERGRSLGIVGESGSGKSVLSRSIMGLVASNAVRSGSIRYQGVDLMALSPKQLRGYWGTQLSMVFQDPMTALNPVMRIGQQIIEPLRVHMSLSRADAKATALALLTSVGIPEAARRLRQYPHEMSGGMRQRVMIAIALACGPNLLFADEPTTALDVTVQAQILDLLAAQQRDRFMAMVLVTHDLGVVAGRADEIAVMYAGRIVEQASSLDLFRHTRHPYTEALLRSIPRLENPSHTRLAAISGRPPDLLHPPQGCKFAARCPRVQDHCREVEPDLIDDGNGHLYRCWYPVDLNARDVAGVAFGETVVTKVAVATSVTAAAPPPPATEPAPPAATEPPPPASPPPPPSGDDALPDTDDPHTHRRLRVQRRRDRPLQARKSRPKHGEGD
ncbi:MAG: ABC transporter ATP-binding protein [Acidimicrobiales bacterium]